MSEKNAILGHLETPFARSRRYPGDFDGIPRRFPAPHPDAVDSHGDLAVAWIERRIAGDEMVRGRLGGNAKLRWWQWLVLQRLLEIDGDGLPCWRVSLVSVGRQQGKSELLCELAAWRCAHPDLFGDRPQEVGHSANSVTMSRRIQSLRWPWAEATGLEIQRQLGDSQVIWPGGSVWRTTAPTNMYGRSLDLALVDEAWKWEADDFWAATFPVMAARPYAQAVLWSTMHDDSRGLLPSLLDDENVAVMLWGAAPDDDPGEESVWRASSAFWDRQRGRDMRMAQSKTGFAAMWLNRWTGKGVSLPGEPLADENAWDAAAGARPRGAPLIGVVEDLWGRSMGAGLLWARPDGGWHVWAGELPELSAWRQLSGRRLALVGLGLRDDPRAVQAGAVAVGMREAATAFPMLRRAIADGRVSWEGDGLAGGWQLRLRPAETSGGLRPLPEQPWPLVKLAAWMVQAASNRADVLAPAAIY